ARHRRFVFDRDRREYAAAHALLRTSLSRHADVAPESWTFHDEPGGKPSPVLEPGMPNLSCNLSHTRGLVACAIALGHPVGIDVEAIDRKIDERIVSRWLSNTHDTPPCQSC